MPPVLKDCGGDVQHGWLDREGLPECKAKQPEHRVQRALRDLRQGACVR